MKKKIYYAHSMSLYNTPQEKRDIELLENLGFEVVNPSSKELEKEVRNIKLCGEGLRKTKDEISRTIMDFFFKEVIPECDALAYRSFIDLKIGAGVSGEIKCAEKLGLPIIELPTITSARALDIEETRTYLKLLGER
jgi:hypothetical protein